MAVKLLRTIRLDPSDRFAFEQAAEPGEWAVPGGFAFADVDPAGLSGKARVAFRSGFLGLSSFGWSTIAVVVSASPAEYEEAVASLAAHLLAAHGAPDAPSARGAAEDEVRFAASLAAHPDQTLVVLHRTADADGVREQFRTVKPGLKFETEAPFRAFSLVEVADDAPTDDVDLAILAGARP